MAGEERRRGGLRCGKDSGTRTREVQQGMGKKRADRTAAKEQRGQHRGSRHHAVVRQHQEGWIHRDEEGAGCLRPPPGACGPSLCSSNLFPRFAQDTVQCLVLLARLQTASRRAFRRRRASAGGRKNLLRLGPFGLSPLCRFGLFRRLAPRMSVHLPRKFPATLSDLDLLSVFSF